MTKDEALKLALEALNEYVNVVVSVNDPNEWTPKVADAGEPARKAITAVKEALAQPEMYTTSQMEKDSFVEANMKRTQMLRNAMDNEHKHMNYREAFPKREYVMPVDRNEVLEEVAKAVYSFKAFEKDTMDSFVAYIRSMKQ